MLGIRHLILLRHLRLMPHFGLEVDLSKFLLHYDNISRLLFRQSLPIQGFSESRGHLN
jgi:hypothetical protein